MTITQRIASTIAALLIWPVLTVWFCLSTAAVIALNVANGVIDIWTFK